MARERSSSKRLVGSATPCWLCHGPANSSTAPPDLSSWTVNVGPSTAVVVTTRHWGNRHARRCHHRPSPIRCGDSYLGRVVNASEPGRSTSLLTGRHLPTGWHVPLRAHAHQPPASIPSASSRRPLFRDRWAISWPTAMTIAIGHSTTSNSAITVRPTYQARCSGLRESATGTPERRLALRFTPRRTGTRPFVGGAGRTIVVVDSLRRGAAPAPPERDFSSGPTIRGPLFSFVPGALPASTESTVLAPYPRSSSTRCPRAPEFRAGSRPCPPRCPARKGQRSRASSALELP